MLGGRRYPAVVEDRSVRMVAEIRVEDESEFAGNALLMPRRRRDDRDAGSIGDRRGRVRGSLRLARAWVRRRRGRSGRGIAIEMCPEVGQRGFEVAQRHRGGGLGLAGVLRFGCDGEARFTHWIDLERAEASAPDPTRTRSFGWHARNQWTSVAVLPTQGADPAASGRRLRLDPPTICGDRRAVVGRC